MKQIIILTSFLFACVIAIAQKVDNQVVEFEYVRFPLLPLPDEIKSFNSKVIIAYEEEVMELKNLKKEDYSEALKKYEIEFAIAKKTQDSLLEIYNSEKEIALASYDSAMIEYKKKPHMERFIENKILHDSEKPAYPYIKYPYVHFPRKPYESAEEYPKIFNKELIADTYLKIDGYTKSSSNSVRIVVTFLGFDFLDPVLRSETSNVYNSETKQTSAVTKYWFEISYRHPMNLKVIGSNESIIIDITFEELMNYTVFKTSPNARVAQSINIKALKESFQDKIVDDNMLFIQNFLNEQFGYTRLTHSATINRIDSKKFDYNTYQKAYEEIVSGFNYLTTNLTKAHEKIKTAIAIWEEELNSCNPSDSKARINSDIGIATNFNLYEAYLWLYDFDKADEHLSKIIGLKPSKKEEELVKKYREFSKEQRRRFQLMR